MDKEELNRKRDRLADNHPIYPGAFRDGFDEAVSLLMPEIDWLRMATGGSRLQTLQNLRDLEDKLKEANKEIERLNGLLDWIRND